MYGSNQFSYQESGPYDEEEVYRQLDLLFERESHLQAIGSSLGIRDTALLNRIQEAGFSPSTAPAIQMIPIVLVAWASNDVTDEESAAAVAAIYESRLSGNVIAMSLVQTWLDDRPDSSLLHLWNDFIRCRLHGSPTSIRLATRARILRQAKAVAVASGGFWGWGKICPAERRILDAIYHAFDEA